MSNPIHDPYASDDESPPGRARPKEARGPQEDGVAPTKRSPWAAALTPLLLILIAVNGVLLVSLSRRAIAEALGVKEAVPVASSTNVEPTAAKSTPPVTPPAPTSSPLPLPSELATTERRTIDVFRSASPSVVFITTLTYRRDSFRRDVMAIPQGTGSGFVWDAAGHIVTNYHVIAKAHAARVTLLDQSSYEAKLVGHAVDKDLAVLRITAPTAKLKPLERGTSTTLVVGQQAIAIGNPFGFDHTLSVGVVSGLGREIKSMGGRPILDVVQTDAAINPGNSGGPLLDSSGRLIGINTAIYSPTRASVGIGFAVPVDTIRRIVPQLIAHGRVIRPGLGIQIADPSVAHRLGLKGVLVIRVMPDSPAQEANMNGTYRDEKTGDIVLGDVIVALDGKPVAKPNDLFKLLEDKQVGQTVKLTVKRASGAVHLNVTLAPINPPKSPHR